MIISRLIHWLTTAALLVTALSLRAQHGHLNAGAAGQNQGDRLVFINGDIFEASSGYVKELPLATEEKYAGYYEGNISLTALPTTIENGGPVSGASAPGSFIMAGVQAVEGPAGGSFAFWEDGSMAPSLSYAAGYEAPVPTSLWSLSDAALGAGAAGADPFGHQHGRTFTATLPGDYLVSFQVFDTSVNGAGGGPIHTPSDVLTIHFRAIPEPSVFALVVCGVCLGGMLRLRKRRTGGPQ
jgi:hypothetical protein